MKYGICFDFRDDLAAALAAIESERRIRSDSIHRRGRSLQAEMECEESGSSLGEHDDGLRTEMAKATKRLRELCAHLRRGEDDSGLQSDCDESMLIVNNSEAEVGRNEREAHSLSVSALLFTLFLSYYQRAIGFFYLSFHLAISSKWHLNDSLPSRIIIIFKNY